MKIKNSKKVFLVYDVDTLKPYLRQMSSMTKEEVEGLNDAFRTAYSWWDSINMGMVVDGDTFDLQQGYNMVSYLLSKHIDINNLIEKGLALEAPKDMYNTNK